MELTKVLNFPLCSISRKTAGLMVREWAKNGQSKAVVAANVHMVMESWDDRYLLAQLSCADLSVLDGMPLVWALRALGREAEHVRGADLTLEVCRQAEAAGLPIGLYGSTPETLTGIQTFLRQEHPALRIPFAVSPPFRDLSHEEDAALVGAIRESGAAILFVGLGCPKQERWMMEHRGQIPCVMLGVGAAFDFLAGTVEHAPGWMQNAGLEWLFRLASDPRRLWKRYLKHNPRFVALFAVQWMRHVLHRVSSRPTS